MKSLVSHASAQRQKNGKRQAQSGLAIALSKQLRITCIVLHQNNKLLAVEIKEFSLIKIVAYFTPKTALETIYQALTEFGSYHILNHYKGKGSKTEPKSYRGISLFYCMYNLSTGIIYQRLQIWVERNRILPSSQYGFRRKLSTIEAFSHLKKKLSIKHNLSCNGKYYACFIDYEKAFDFVNRNLQLTKLIKNGLHGKMLHTIQSVLKCNFQQILDGEFLSNEIEQKSGVAQGDKLSPLLFSLFIADLYFKLKCKALDVIFYADYLVLGSHSQCQLQQSLNNLNTYCNRNYLKINVNKTKCIKFRRSGRLAIDEKFYISK